MGITIQCWYLLNIQYGNYGYRICSHYPMLVFVEYPIWELLSNVWISHMGITRISDMGITIQCWYL